ncbi:MAG TPA: secretin N-terminal domain-containing protein [Burkholderiales bacterium]|nr:secretin N-terminal domain-containing protein [Burkholderiales bacterium]
MTARPVLAMAVLTLIAGCTLPPRPPTSVGDHITGELDKALSDRKPQAAPPAVSEALLPPLRMDMPSVAGQPLEPRFDLAVNNAPASQVFMSLVSGTRYSMLVHPGVSGTISVSLKDVTMREALDALRDLYGYQYRIQGSRISILPAGIQTRVFKVNYLTGQRRGTSDVRVQSGSVSDAASSGVGGQVPGAIPALPGTLNPGQLPTARSIDSSRISTQQVTDFWAELRAALVAIVGSGEGRSVVVTPHSGVIVVRAMPEELHSVEQYLRETRVAVERQVMLEAKIIQVELSDAYQAGINWAVFKNNFAVGQSSNALGTTQLSANPPGAALLANRQAVNIPERTATITAATNPNPASAVFGIALQTANFAALLQFLETQGAVQVLSSPRVATLNNEKAVLKVGTDEFFVTNVSTVTTTTGTATQQSPTVTVAPFFSGILLDVTPRIDDAGGIMLHIHPSISEVTESQRTVELGGNIPSITLPLARSAVSETDTIVRASSGNIVAIGGLMSVEVQDNRGGIPGLDLPILRNAVRQTSKRELVILLKATVLADDEAWQEDLRRTEERLKDFYPSTPKGLRR